MRTNATLAFTGERFVPEISGNIELEHMHRYIYALAFAKGKTILDIASGEGYGTALLASQAVFVTGVDIAEDAVAHARQKYRLPNLEFRLGSCSKIPLPDATVDLVVSFETIEHHDEHEQMLAEIKRVLKPDGMVIISSPDKAIYTDKRDYHNPFHVKELYRDEFEALFRSHFKNVVGLGQKVMFGSGIVPCVEGSQTAFTSVGMGGTTSNPGLVEATYNLVLASDAALPAAPASFLDVDINASETVKNWRATVAKRDSDITAAKKNIQELTAHLRRLDEFIAQKDTQIAEYLYHLDRINASGWWRLGMWLDRFIRAPRALLLSLLAKSQFATPSTVPEPERVTILPETIALPVTSPNPEVSVVILSYGQVDYTLRCLASITQHPPLSSIELIVSDDCSDASDLEKLRQVANLAFLQPPENLGFLKHANWAVAQTKGNYVLLLNNDTELKPGAIDALVETARTTQNVGLVGSKLVYPDGRLQEAGGIVWNDASASNYGRFDDANKPEYNYVRDADYVSAAAILVPRAVWEQLGGFDESFAPAYYEDTDLAFRLRQSGLRVIYQPRSVVVHYEGISHGTDVDSGVKAYQVANRRHMKERWLSTLLAGQYENGEHVMRARDRSKNCRVMLIIDHYVPEPDRDAGSRNIIEIIKSLQADGWVIKFWPENLFYDPVYTPKLQQMEVETIYSPWVTSFDDWISAHSGEIDLVFLSRPTVSRNYIDLNSTYYP